jgi:hypothetical protein
MDKKIVKNKKKSSFFLIVLYVIVISDNDLKTFFQLHKKTIKKQIFIHLNDQVNLFSLHFVAVAVYILFNN